MWCLHLSRAQNPSILMLCLPQDIDLICMVRSITAMFEFQIFLRREKREAQGTILSFKGMTQKVSHLSPQNSFAVTQSSACTQRQVKLGNVAVILYNLVPIQNSGICCIRKENDYQNKTTSLCDTLVYISYVI